MFFKIFIALGIFVADLSFAQDEPRENYCTEMCTMICNNYFDNAGINPAQSAWNECENTCMDDKCD